MRALQTRRAVCGSWVPRIQPRHVAEGFLDTPWSWSPTGAQLAYADDDELILLDPDDVEANADRDRRGHHLQDRVGTGRPVDRLLRRAPATGASDASSFGVFVVRSGGEPGRVSDAARDDGIGWSPDGGSLLLDRVESGRSVIEVVAADGSDERVLVEGPMHEGPGAPVWSPDGSRIAFIRTPRVGGGYRMEIWVMGADGQGQIRLGVGDSETWGGGPVWSPDSRRIAWASFFGRDWVVADADGGGPPAADRPAGGRTMATGLSPAADRAISAGDGTRRNPMKHLMCGFAGSGSDGVRCMRIDGGCTAAPGHRAVAAAGGALLDDCPTLPCEGPLEPGEYHWTYFDPTMTFTIPSPGWTWPYAGSLRDVRQR